jgi:hypothetical protein
MSLPIPIVRRLAALTLAAAAPIAQAQTAQQLEERRLQYNEDRRRELDRASGEGVGQGNLFAVPDAPVSPSSGVQPDPAAAAAVDKARRNWQRQPPLAAERNRLLGRWKLDATRKPTNLFEEMAGAFGHNPCAMLWGTKVWEFRPKQMINGDSAAPDMALDTEYRGDARSVAVLPKEFFKLLVFEFVGPDRVRQSDCEFVRVVAPAQSAGIGGQAGRPAATAGARPAAAPAPTVAAAAPSAPPGVGSRGCPTNLIDQVGRARLPDAQRAVLARFANVQSRTLGNGNRQLLANGSPCDDARLHATLYEFNTTGVLQQVSLLWKRPGGPMPSPIFTERAAALARDFNAPAPQQLGTLEVVLPDRRIVLRDLADGLLEAYGPAR